jgi:hypothetical protein
LRLPICLSGSMFNLAIRSVNERSRIDRIGGHCIEIIYSTTPGSSGSVPYVMELGDFNTRQPCTSCMAHPSRGRGRCCSRHQSLMPIIKKTASGRRCYWPSPPLWLTSFGRYPLWRKGQNMRDSRLAKVTKSFQQKRSRESKQLERRTNET